MAKILKRLLKREIYEGTRLVWQAFSKLEKRLYVFLSYFLSIFFVLGILVCWYADGSFPWLIFAQTLSLMLFILLLPIAGQGMILVSRLSAACKDQDN